eukprot:gene15231-biopygen5404
MLKVAMLRTMIVMTVPCGDANNDDDEDDDFKDDWIARGPGCHGLPRTPPRPIGLPLPLSFVLCRFCHCTNSSGRRAASPAAASGHGGRQISTR